MMGEHDRPRSTRTSWRKCSKMLCYLKFQDYFCCNRKHNSSPPFRSYTTPISLYNEHEQKQALFERTFGASLSQKKRTTADCIDPSVIFHLNSGFCALRYASMFRYPPYRVNHRVVFFQHPGLERAREGEMVGMIFIHPGKSHVSFKVARDGVVRPCSAVCALWSGR